MIKFFDAVHGKDLTVHSYGLCSCCGAHVDLSGKEIERLECAPLPLRGLAFTPLPSSVTTVKSREASYDYTLYTLTPVIVEFPDGDKLLITETHRSEHD